MREGVSKFGDPILSFLIDRFLAGSIDSTIAHGVAERLRRIDRVLEVAVDPKKVEKLGSTKLALVEKLKALDAANKAATTSARKAALASLHTPVDFKTFTTITMRLAAKELGESVGVAGPDDARRSIELTLAAYLRALSVPLPEALK